SQPVEESIAEIEPVVLGFQVADWSKVQREQLDTGAQPVTNLLGDVDPDFGELEVATFGLAYVVVVGALDEPLANKAVNVDCRCGALLSPGPPRFTYSSRPYRSTNPIESSAHLAPRVA